MLYKLNVFDNALLIHNICWAKDNEVLTVCHWIPSEHETNRVRGLKLFYLTVITNLCSDSPHKKTK